MLQAPNHLVYRKSVVFQAFLVRLNRKPCMVVFNQLRRSRPFLYSDPLVLRGVKRQLTALEKLVPIGPIHLIRLESEIAWRRQ